MVLSMFVKVIISTKNDSTWIILKQIPVKDQEINSFSPFSFQVPMSTTIYIYLVSCTKPKLFGMEAENVGKRRKKNQPQSKYNL